MKVRVGLGYDVHQLAPDLPLILGGVQIKSELGIVAHSDGDILCHAITDALLGALNLGDIGLHFPDDAEINKNRSSIEMLIEVLSILKDKSFSIGNIDTIISLEQPKIRPFIDKIQQNLALNLDLPIEDISIKATTEEGLGFIGTRQGISCRAVVLIQKEH